MDGDGSPSESSAGGVGAQPTHVTSSTPAGAAGPPPEFLDRIAFADKTDDEIAAARSEDAAVAQLEARRSYFSKMRQLDMAAGLDAMKGPEGASIMAAEIEREQAHDDVIQRRDLRRSRRAETVAVLGFLALGVVFGGILLDRWAPGPKAAAPLPAGQAADAAPPSPPASAAPAASIIPASASAAPASAGVPDASVAAPGGGSAGTLQGQFDLASMATKGSSIEMLRKVISENQIILTYEKGIGAATPATVRGTIALTITLNDEMLFAIHSAVGQGALGIDPPPMPDSWRGCTTTTEMRGDLVGAQTAPGKTSHKGTASLTLRGSVQGCEKTGANITASPPQDLRRVPWTASGGEAGLKGKLTFPASADVAPGTSWAFAVDSP